MLIAVFILCLAVLQNEAAQAITADLEKILKNSEKLVANLTVNRLPPNDVFGGLIRILHDFLTHSTRGISSPRRGMCKTRFINWGFNEVKINVQPYGVCTYCCPIDKPMRFIRFYFTNKVSNGKMVQLKLNRKPGALRAAGVNSLSPTVIFIHGFGEFGLGNSPRLIRDAYLSRKEDYNIILVDWGELSAIPWYPQAVNSSKLVGNELAKFIKFYSKTGELPISNIHLVGFSLGAHIAGFTGKHLKGQQTIPRLTALDPAAPLYPTEDPSQRVSKFDADYVDVIHTDAGKFGISISLGHADFYPNGGSYIQPGCEPSNLAERRIFEELGTCSHQRAWRFYAESVRNPQAFPATKCGIMENGSLRQCRFVTESYMGFSANKSTTQGNYYLTTNNRKPFSRSSKEQERYMKAINLVL